MFILVGIIIGAVAGIVCGWVFGTDMLAIKWLGDLFLDTLKMLIVPLIVAAVVSGVASLGDVRKLGRLGGITVAYYFITTAMAVLLGLILVNIIQPGAGLTVPAGVTVDVSDKDVGVTEILLSLVNPNIVSAAAEGLFLPLIVFSIMLAAALTTVGKRGEHVIEFFNGINDAMMTLVTWLMYLAPIGIFALIAARLGQAGGGEAFLAELRAVGAYVVTVLLGLVLHFGVLVVILVVLGRQKLTFVTGLGRALLTAFGTASSSATLPLTMECTRECGIGERAVRFVLPLGSTVNMNGTALYEAVAAMFIAQAYGIDLSIGQQAIVFVTASLAAVGAAGIPEAGLVTMVIVLKAVGLPLDGIALLLAVDWFLDRFRTVVNIWGDAVGAAVVQRLAPDVSGKAE
jgi:Na+/H+-dicarboxylate symporter